MRSVSTSSRLVSAYREIEDNRFPVVVTTGESHDEDGQEEVTGGEQEETAQESVQTVEARPASRSRREPDVTLQSLDDFVEFFISAGKKGIAINRYKGLGEMNPDTLWTTTMDPENRTLLQVRAEDHAEADQMFTTLMGDQVEPRRKFIEDNALDVRNLDV
jgi:DNA gyrase subunit B